MTDWKRARVQAERVKHQLGAFEPERLIPVFDNGNLLCPVCGENTIDRKDYDDVGSVTIFPDRDEYDSPAGSRGGYICIDLMCTDVHLFSMFIGNHKGAETISLMVRKDV
jgi:hypothetical protein